MHANPDIVGKACQVRLNAFESLLSPSRIHQREGQVALITGGTIRASLTEHIRKSCCFVR